MPITKKSKGAKGLPKRTYNPIRRRKYDLYLLRSTCRVCMLVFRTPLLKKKHDASIHKSKIGLNPRRLAK